MPKLMRSGLGRDYLLRLNGNTQLGEDWWVNGMFGEMTSHGHGTEPTTMEQAAKTGGNTAQHR